MQNLTKCEETNDLPLLLTKQALILKFSSTENLNELVTEHLVIMYLKFKVFLKTEHAEFKQKAQKWPEFFNEESCLDRLANLTEN